MYIKRKVNIASKLVRKSQFFFGPRSTGKTSYISSELSDDVILRWDLLNTRIRRQAERDPGILHEEVMALEKSEGIVVIDEIQKVPDLLDEVHRLIEENKGLRFLLTGSSARKFVRSGVNLLGGRAGKCYMFPFVYPEVCNIDYSLDHIFYSGLLPSAYLSDDPDSVLEDYVDTYLYDEIQSEGVVRNLPAFSKFLEIATLSTGNILNFSNIASDVGLSKTSIREWYQILTDTLLGFELSPFTKTKKRKPIETAKYYLFDVGVLRSILDLNPPRENQTEYGIFFETFLLNEIRAYLNYTEKDRKYPLSFWRSTGGFEVDAIIGDEVALEFKTAKALVKRDFRGLSAFFEEGIAKKYIIVSREERKRLVDGTFLVYPWKEFLSDLWEGKII